MPINDPIDANLITPEDYKRIWKDVNKAIAERRSYQLYYRMMIVSEDYKWVWEQGQALYTEAGAPCAL